MSGAGDEEGLERKGCQLVAVRANMPLTSASLHSPGRDGSAPLRPEAQTCPQTRSLMGCLHAVSSLVVAFTARFGVKLLLRFASIRFYSHSVT